MAAGLDPKRQYRITYAHLQSIRRELRKVGVVSTYANRALTGAGDTFVIWYRRLNASNGECALLPCIEIFPKMEDRAKRERFDYLDFNRGLKRLNELFGKREVTA